MKKYFSIVGLSLCCLKAEAQYVPSWWLDPTTPVLITGGGAVRNNFGLANEGQLKWIATRAKNHLDLTLGADAGINATVSAFSSSNNYAPINVGQLKIVALPFYVRLIAVGYNTNQNLKANGYSPLWTSAYPWNTTTPVNDNYKPVTIGQLKAVFSFDIVDSNQNGTLDYLEGIYPAASNTRDTDGDGVADVDDAFPNDPTKSVLLIYDSNDHTGPTITLTKPSGATLAP